jgi:hypothetical protein
MEFLISCVYIRTLDAFVCLLILTRSLGGLAGQTQRRARPTRARPSPRDVGLVVRVDQRPDGLPSRRRPRGHQCQQQARRRFRPRCLPCAAV